MEEKEEDMKKKERFRRHAESKERKQIRQQEELKS